MASVSTWQGWRRQRREATIKAWTDWSTTNLEARKALSTHLGLNALTASQANQFIGPTGSVEGKGGTILTDADRSTTANAMVQVLNGLERLAVGVERKVYDLETLSELGGTIIVLSYTRFAAYVAARRQTPLLDERQERAYTSLEMLSRQISAKRFDEDRVKHFQS